MLPASGRFLSSSLSRREGRLLTLMEDAAGRAEVESEKQSPHTAGFKA
jgi:hypothetical protein